MTEVEMETMSIKARRYLATWFLVVGIAFIFVSCSATSLEIPKTGNILGLSEKASDEIREEERVSEVLNQDASYLSLFNSVSNTDINLDRYVTEGEELRYQAQWRGLPAGNIRLVAKRKIELKSRDVFNFELNVESNDFLNAFYPVNTTINSFVDAENGRSYLIRRRVSERNRSYKDRLEFKYDYRKANGITDPISKYSMVGENNKEQSTAPFPIPGNMQDMVSVIYYIRGMELTKVGDSCTVLVGGRQKPVITRLTVVGEETITIPNIGTFDCLVIEPDTDGTNLSGNLVATRGGETVWLERNSRIPVMLRAELPKPVGTVIATLIQAKNCPLNFKPQE